MKRLQLQSATYARRKAAQNLRRMANSFQKPTEPIAPKTYHFSKKRIDVAKLQLAIAKNITAWTTQTT